MRIPSSAGVSGYAQLQAALTTISAKSTSQSTAPRSTGTASTSLGLSAATVADVTGMSTDELQGFQSYSVTGPGVTPRFSGNNDTFSIVDTAGTVVTFYASGAQPSAVKGALVRYGPGISEEAKTAATNLALVYLRQHIDDHSVSAESWDKPLFDFHA